MAVRGKVLIVEDDRAICSFMRRVLEANGFRAAAIDAVIAAVETTRALGKG